MLCIMSEEQLAPPVQYKGTTVSDSEFRCHNCCTPTPIDLLDAKPTRLAGPGGDPVQRLQELRDALFNNEDCDRLECQACYGPGWEAAS
jgi:hypothetical protein